MKTELLFRGIFDKVNSPLKFQKFEEFSGYYIFWVTWRDNLVFSFFICFGGQNFLNFSISFISISRNMLQKWKLQSFLYKGLSDLNFIKIKIFLNELENE